MTTDYLQSIDTIFRAKKALKSDNGKAFLELEKELISLDNSEAYFILGLAYETADLNFKPFKRSEKKAIEFYSKAFKYGHLEAGIELYNILEHKNDLQSKMQSRTILISCAERDYRMAFKLAKYIIEKERQNIKTALTILNHLKVWWFENQSKVFNLLGKIYCEGTVVEKNINNGIKLYNISKEKGCELAIRELGQIYCSGKYGVSIDEKKAIENFKLLEKSKNEILSEEAKHYIKKLKNNLNTQ